MNKYNARKTTIKGIKFDSKKEALRYIQLLELEKKGIIKKLILQPKFLLQDKFKHQSKTIKSINYIADFTYIKNNQVIVEDVKGIRTSVYNLKKKLFLKLYGSKIILKEV